jgi:hypothetical protein
MKNLNDIPKKNNFKAPEGYFDSFSNDLRDRMQANKKKEKVTLFQVFKPYLYFASFFFVLAFLIKLGLNIVTDDFNNQNNNNTEIANISEDYYEYELISEEMIYEGIVTESTNTDDTLSEEAILAYLTEEEIESLIYE